VGVASGKGSCFYIYQVLTTKLISVIIGAALRPPDLSKNVILFFKPRGQDKMVAPRPRGARDPFGTSRQKVFLDRNPRIGTRSSEGGGDKVGPSCRLIQWQLFVTRIFPVECKNGNSLPPCVTSCSEATLDHSVLHIRRTGQRTRGPDDVVSISLHTKKTSTTHIKFLNHKTILPFPPPSPLPTPLIIPHINHSLSHTMSPHIQLHINPIPPPSKQLRILNVSDGEGVVQRWTGMKSEHRFVCGGEECDERV
jgi:hypothetical protein